MPRSRRGREKTPDLLVCRAFDLDNYARLRDLARSTEHCVMPQSGLIRTGG